MDTLSKSVIELLREEIHSYQGLEKGYSPDVISLAGASHREMMAFLSRRNLNSEALQDDQQSAIISRHNTKEIMLLINNEGLYENVMLELIATCGRQEIAELVKLQYCYNSTIKALLQKGYYHEAETAMDKLASNLDDETISMLKKKRCEKALVIYLNGFDEEDFENFPLSTQNSLSLILSQMNNAIAAHIAKSGFPYGAEQVFIEFGSDELVKAYVLRYKLFDESGLRLIERGNRDLLETYILSFELGEKSEIQFFKSDWHNLAMEYVLVHTLSEKAEKLLISLKKEAVLIEYLEHDNLSAPAMIELLKSDLHDALSKALDSCGLDEAMQIFMLQNCSAATIRLYIDKYSFTENAEVELITQIELKGAAYLELLRYYLQKFDYFLYEPAESAWVMLGSKQDIKLYISNQRLCPSSEQNLIRRGDSELIILYLQKFCPCEEAVEMLLERGIKDEIKILLEKYYPQLGLS